MIRQNIPSLPGVMKGKVIADHFGVGLFGRGFVFLGKIDRRHLF
jgi:hypothetical protein